MEVSSIASQALSLKENLTSTQMGYAAIKQEAETAKKMADMLTQNSKTVQPSPNAEPGGFSTYA